MKKKNIYRIAAWLLLMLAVCAPPSPSRAAQSYNDRLTEDIAAEISELFSTKIKQPKDGSILVAVSAFTDLTGKYQADPAELRKLLLGKLTLAGRFKPSGISKFDAAYGSLYPSKSIDDLDQDELVKLAETAGVAYVLSGKIVSQDSKTVLNLSVYDAQKGILLFTPVFPFDKKQGAAAPEKPATPDKAEKVTPPAKNEKPNKPDTPEKTEGETPAAAFDTTPGKISFFTGDLPKSPAVDFLPVNLDADAKPEVIFLTTSSMEIVKLAGTKAASFWNNEYKKSFPLRGLAGAIFAKQIAGKPVLFVSMNVFSGTIVYQWENDNPEKKKNLDHFVAHLDPRSGAALMGDYGKGRVSFNGATSYMAETPAGDSGAKYGYKLPGDYYAGCIADWAKGEPDQTLLATVDETGNLKVFKGGKSVAETGPRAGATLDCWKSPSTGNIYMVTSTNAVGKDAVLMFVLRKKANGFTLDKAWSSSQFEGALSRARFHDLNGDGKPEILGVIEKTPASAPKFFYVFPTFAKEDLP